MFSDESKFKYEVKCFNIAFLLEDYTIINDLTAFLKTRIYKFIRYDL